ncbi:MAG TPA: diaminopimelate epimerase [Magnetospirillaceae bacterium]|jgi:diaminopimelate epimerase
MHGLGNDFVVLDARQRAIPLPEATVRAIADRHTGVGFDEMLIIEAARDPQAEFYMGIRNADGSEAEACGNGARCVAWLLMQERGTNHIVLETRGGLIEAQIESDGRVTVDMGPARTDWREIPLSAPIDTLHLPITEGPLTDPVGVSMGNPHAVFFVPDAEAIDLPALGPGLEHHKLFPQRANIEVVSILSPTQIRMRVWERGAGITRACGSGACAVLVAAVRRGLTGRKAEIVLDGGPLSIQWREDGHVLMTGPVTLAFAGTLDPALLP